MKLTIRSYDPYLTKISSHCIKSVVLHKLMEDPEYFKEEFNLYKNYMECMDLLRRMVNRECIPDIFFNDINLLRANEEDMSVQKQVLEELYRELCENNQAAVLGFHFDTSDLCIIC